MKFSKPVRNTLLIIILSFFFHLFSIKPVVGQTIIPERMLILSDDMALSSETSIDILTTNFSVDENSAVGEIVDTVETSATDTVLFEILDLVGYFDVHDTSGIITITRTPDHEEFEMIDFRVRAALADGVHIADTALISVYINDLNEPPVVDSATFEVSEKSPKLSLVGEIQATDPDSGDVLQFSLLENPNNIFRIDPNTGDILVNDSTALDQQLNSTLLVSVMAADDNIPSLTDTAQIKINIVDLVSSESKRLNNTKPVLYPNPATSKLSILFHSADGGNVSVSLELYDIAGKRLKSIDVKTPVQGHYNLDLSTLQTGFYILRIGRADQNFSYRFFKE